MRAGDGEAEKRAVEPQRVKREMEGEIQRQFKLLVEPPGQGRGFAGKGAKVIEVPTTEDHLRRDSP